MNRIKELRTECDLSLKELSNYVGIGETSLNKIENGITALKQDVIENIAGFFSVSCDYLLCVSERGIFVERDGVLQESSRNIVRSLRQRKQIKYSFINLNNKIKVVRNVIDYSENDDMHQTKIQLVDSIESLDEEQIKKTLKFIEEFIK